MIKKDIRKMILPLAVMLCLVITPFIATPVKAANPGPFFSISILAPNTNPARNQWATLMVEQLPKIGIAVDVFDHTGWAQISPRTWGHPGPYPVPTYDEGGFDILFVGWSWGLDWDPTGLYNTAGITPDGDNFYQYSNPEMDWAIANYTQSFVLADRIDWCEEIQAILYEDLPEICIIYPLSVYPHVDGFTGWSGLLWASIYQPMENWEIPGQSEFHYATPADFEDFHIHTYESVYDAQWLRQIYNGLVERDPALGNGYGPRVAESFSSADGMTYNVEIKSTAVWADGTPLTVDDVIYNYQLAVTPDLGGTGYSTNILYWDNDSITKINDYEMTIEFNTPYVFQDGNVGLDLIPKHIWESVAPADHQATAVDWAKNQPSKMFGAGPFMLEEYDSTNGVIHLAANPHFADWYGSAPKFDDVYFEFYGSKEGALAALAAGEIDMVDAQFSAQLDELDIPGATYTLVEDPGTQEMGLNMEHPQLGTGALCPIAGAESAKHIRKAISHMVPREIIVEEILNGIGAMATTGCPNVAVGYDTTLEPYEYSISIALQHMKDAGYDVTIPTTEITGIGLIVVVGILALAGASQVFFLKRRK
ncbi:MAG: ABC transporter substrate-binding protein [Candidatus Thorarchaeota archaeon]